MEFWNNSYKAAYAQIMEDVGTPIVKEPEPANEDHKEEQKEEIKQEKSVRRYSKKKKDDDVLVQLNIANAIEKWLLNSNYEFVECDYEIHEM